MINFAHNFLFCHNEKTAGTSITQHLRKVKGNYYVTSNLFEPNLASLECGVLDDNVGNELGHYPNQHIALNVWANFIELGDYFTFGFVRNPKERMLSLYLQQLKALGYWKGGDIPDWTLTIDEELSGHLKIPPGKYKFTFDFFVREFVPNAGINQYEQFHSPDGNCLASFVGRYENLENDWKHICEKIKVPYVRLAKTNVSPFVNYDEFYTPDLLEFFVDKYGKEYEAYGYEKG